MAIDRCILQAMGFQYAPFDARESWEHQPVWVEAWREPESGARVIYAAVDPLRSGGGVVNGDVDALRAVVEAIIWSSRHRDW